MGTSAAERIAIDITSSAQLEAVRQSRAAVTGIGQDTAKAAAETDKITVATDAFNKALAKHNGDVNKAAREVAGLAKQEKDAAAEIEKAQAAVQRQGMAMARADEQALKMNAAFDAERGTAAVVARVNDQVAKLPSGLRTATNAMGIMTQAAMTGSGSMAGLATAAGNVAQGIAAVSTSARVAATATGIGALVTVLGLVVGAFVKSQQAAKEAAKAFHESLADMINAGDVEKMKKAAQDLWVGTPAKAFKDGIAAMEREQARLIEVVNKAGFNVNAKTGLTTSAASNEDIANLRRVSQALVDAKKKLVELKQAALDTQNVPRIFAGIPLGAPGTRSTATPLTAGAGVPTMGNVVGDLGRLPGVVGASHLGNRSIEQYLREQSNAREGMDLSRMNIKVKPLPADRQEGIASEFNRQVAQPLAGIIQSGLADTLGSAIADGISAGFAHQGIAGAFKAAGKTILAGIGGIFQQMGAVWIKYGIVMTGLGHALFNPFTSGPAAIAIGAALTTLGSVIGGIARSGGAGGGAGSGAANAQFIPRAAGGGGGNQVINLITTDPYSGRAISIVSYELTRAGVLKKPMVIPPTTGLQQAA